MSRELSAIRSRLIPDNLFAALAALTADSPHEKRAKVAAAVLASGQGERLFSEAERNEVAGVVGHVAATVDEDAGRAARWRAAHESTARRTQDLLTQAERVASALAGRGIPLVALKNGGIARGIVGCEGCAPMGDLDLLVERDSFREAHAVMEGMGFSFRFRSTLEEATVESAEKSGGSEFLFRSPEGRELWFELQWRAVAGRWIPPSQEPPTASLMERSVSIPGSPLRLLAPADNLLQVCLHTAKHSYVRAPGFRLHTDVDRIVRRQVVPWDVFIREVLRLRVRTAVWFSLAIPAAVFGTPVPNEVLADIRPARWKVRVLRRMIASAGLFDPNARKFSRPAYLAFNGFLFDDFAALKESAFGSTRPNGRADEGDSEAGRAWRRIRHLAALLWKRHKT